MQTKRQVHSNCTINDWKAGIHEAWEVAAHNEGQRFLESRQRLWSFAERRDYIDKWLQEKHPSLWNIPTPCTICQEVISEAVLSGKKPFEITAEVREHLRSIKAFVMSKRMTARKLAEMRGDPGE